METSSQQQQRPLSIESFSYSWLVNLKPEEPSSPAADDFEESSNSFIEMDPRMPPSKRFFHHHDFDFDFPEQSPPIALLHADELFSDGYLMPFFLTTDSSPFTKNSDAKISNYDDAIMSSSNHDSVADHVHHPDSAGSDGQRVSGGMRTRRCSSLRRYGKLSKRMFEKYLDFIRRRFHSGRVVNLRSASTRSEMSSRVNPAEVINNSDGKLGAMRRWSSSAAEVSPRISVAYSIGRRSSCDSESSIYEAVLHCKRSIINHGE
ncbi:Probable membrane-associated kinase regulator 6 [Linum grandiflorum]